MSNMLRNCLSWSLVMAWGILFTLISGGLVPALSEDTQPELRKFNPQIVSEPGCPVEVTGARTELEVDPFGTPVAARHYIDYRNVSNKSVCGVKFRIGYVADDGKIHQPYVNGDDRHDLQPGEQASHKWRGDKVDPRTVAVKMRVLKVRFGDGGVWESAKAAESNAQQQQGFAPLTTEAPGSDVADHAPGTPVQFRDYGQQGFRTFPDRTTTGTVPLNQVPAPSPAGFAPDAFGTVGPPGASAPAAATPAAAPPDAWQTAAPPVSSTPDGPAEPAAAGPGSALGQPSFAPVQPSVPVQAVPNGVTTTQPGGLPATPGAGSQTPPAVRSSSTAATTMPAAAPVDPLTALDQLLGTAGSSKGQGQGTSMDASKAVPTPPATAAPTPPASPTAAPIAPSPLPQSTAPGDGTLQAPADKPDLDPNKANAAGDDFSNQSN
jgi:hypothetical protein